jgi:predicted alpha/beta hydrolase family esterase
MTADAATALPPVLVLPGYGDSGPRHWQSRWEAADPTWRRVVQRDWVRPTLAEWLPALDHAIAGCERPPILVGHSLGCMLVAHWARSARRPVAAALLVAPVDVEVVVLIDDNVASFTPVPLAPLPFRSVVVASTDDPYVSPERAEAFARAWGSRFVSIGAAGHINADSGYGEWPEGRRLLDELRER